MKKLRMLVVLILIGFLPSNSIADEMGAYFIGYTFYVVGAVILADIPTSLVVWGSGELFGGDGRLSRTYCYGFFGGLLGLFVASKASGEGKGEAIFWSGLLAGNVLGYLSKKGNLEARNMAF